MYLREDHHVTTYNRILENVISWVYAVQKYMTIETPIIRAACRQILLQEDLVAAGRANEDGWMSLVQVKRPESSK